MRMKRCRWPTNLDDDTDPADPRNGRLNGNTSSSCEDEDFDSEGGSSSSTDEYDVETYLAEGLHQEGLKLATFLSRLRGSRFDECGQHLLRSHSHDRHADATSILSCIPPPRYALSRKRQNRGDDVRHITNGERRTPKRLAPWALPMPVNLGRKRVIAPKRLERDGSTDYEVASSPGDLVEGDERNGDVHRSNTSSSGQLDEDSDSCAGGESTSQYLDEVDLFDEQLHARPVNNSGEGLHWESIPGEGDANDESPSTQHRTLRSGAAEDFDCVFELDM